MPAPQNEPSDFDFVQNFLSKSENDQRRLLAQLREGLAVGGIAAEIPGIWMGQLEANEQARARIAELGDAPPQKLPKSKARKRW